MVQPTLPSTETIMQTNPYNPLGYGLLVLALLVAIAVLWRHYLSSVREHKKELEALRAENRRQVDLMLKINAESIPILTKAVDLYAGEKVENSDLKVLLDSALKDHNEIKLILNDLKRGNGW